MGLDEFGEEKITSLTGFRTPTVELVLYLLCRIGTLCRPDRVCDHRPRTAEYLKTRLANDSQGREEKMRDVVIAARISLNEGHLGLSCLYDAASLIMPYSLF